MNGLISAIAGTINARLLYPASHPRVMEGCEKVASLTTEVVSDLPGEELTFLVVDDDLVVGGEVYRQGSITERQFVELLTSRSIERLTLAAGLEPSEVLDLVNALAEDRRPESSPHLVLGHIEIPEDELEEEEFSDDDLVNEIETVREVFMKVRAGEELPMTPVTRLVRSLLSSLKQSAKKTVNLAPLKKHDEYTFVHSINVSLLVMAQARSFRLSDERVHEFGIAGLLHDIGKLQIPLEVLNCPGKLEGKDWEVMKSHSAEGALLLTKNRDSSPLSILVAFEHHLRYDGEPNYPVLPKPRYPNLASRMTAVADSFDAMSTIRPYQQPLMRSKALGILQDRAGSFYDPLLVSNFVRIVKESEQLDIGEEKS